MAYVVPGAATDLSELGADLGRAVDELIDSGRLGSIPEGVYDRESGLTDEGRMRLEKALIAALSRSEGKTAGEPTLTSSSRTLQLLTKVKVYLNPMKKKDEKAFSQIYMTQLEHLTDEQFEWVSSKYAAALVQSAEFDGDGAEHKGCDFDQCKQWLDELLRIVARRDLVGSSLDLFANYGE